MFRIYEKDFRIYNYTLWSRARFFSPWDCFPVVDVFVLSESSGIAQQIWTENCHNMSERWHHPKKISSWSRYSSKVTSLSKWLIFFMKTSTCTTKLLVWKDWESFVHKQEMINHKCSKLMYIVLLLCHLVLVLLVHLLSTELLGVIFNKQFYANLYLLRTVAGMKEEVIWPFMNFLEMRIFLELILLQLLFFEWMVNTFHFCPHTVLRGVLGTTGRIIVFVNFHLYSVILYRLKISVFLGG